MIAKTVQTSFVSGEISPRLYGRTDIDQYYTSAQEITNFIPVPQGPVIRRAGSRFVEALPNGSVRLVPFTYATGQSFTLIFHSNGQMYVGFREGMITGADGSLYSVAHGIPTNQLQVFGYAQNGNVLYITSISFAPKKLTRAANDNWTFTTETFIAKPGNWVENNWPSLITFFEQRAVYAGSPSAPRTLWISRTALLNDFTLQIGGKVLDDCAIVYTMTDKTADRIKWIDGLDALFLATDSGEFRLDTGTLGAAITPANIKITKLTGYGAYRADAAILGQGLAYLHKGRKSIRFISIDSFGTFNNIDLLLLANHFGNYTITSLAVQNDFTSYLWCTTAEGPLLCCTYDKENKVLAWSKHEIGGGRKVLGLNLTLENDGSTAVWLACQGYNDKIYIEVIPKTILEPQKSEDSAFLDSYVETVPARAAGPVTIRGLSHLAGKEVSIFIDGWVHPSQRVSAEGTIKLQSSGSRIMAGLPYTSRLKTNTYQSQEADTRGNIRRFFKAGITLIKSLGLTIYSNAQKQEAYMGPTRIMNKAKELFTGVKEVNLPGNYDTSVQLIIETDKPLPCEIANIILYFNHGQ